MGSKVESESYIPVGTIYFEEREDGLLHEKEVLKRTMLQHELTFKHQVHELHRLYRVQRDLMQEYQQNNTNSQTNSFSSQNPTNNNNNNTNNFEFIREDSAQSSFKIENRNISINGNTNGSVFGKREVMDLNEDANANLSTFGKRGVVDLNEDSGNISVFGKRVADGNGINLNGSGLDFMGVNKRIGFDEGSGSGQVGLFPDREKGGSSAGMNNNFFTSQINPQQPILTTSNNNHNSNNPFPNNNNNNNPFPNNNNNQFPINNNHFLINYKPVQQSIIFPNQFSVNPQLFPQSLTINFDPSQTNNNENNNNNNTNNNVSYPVLDSSPHYINLDKNKNKSPIPGFIHTVPVQVPVFNNGAFNAGTNENLSNSSFYFNNNFSKNPTHINVPLQNSLNPPRNPNPTSLFGNQNPKLNWDRNSNLNLNEPAQEGIIQNNINNNNNTNNSNNNKGVKIFGANCEKANETKLLGFPVFTNPSSNSSSEFKPVPDLASQKPVPDLAIQKPVRDSVPDLESGNKRTVIDLNEAYSPLENNNNNINNNDASNEIDNKGKKAIISFDLNDDLSCENDSSALELEAAHSIITLSKASKTVHKPSAPVGSDPLPWFADIAVAGHSDPLPKSESDTDSYEQSVLKLEPVTTEDRFGPDKFSPETGHPGQTGQEGYGSMLYSKGKRGPARKRRQKRDFQRDVLPALASLSRVEVSEDLQLIGGLVRASGQEFDMAVTRRVGRSGSNRRQQRASPAGGQTGRSDPLRGCTQGSAAQAIPVAVPIERPPRFPVSHQMGLVRVDQVREQEMRRYEQQVGLVRVDQVQGQQQSVIGWERFTRRARRPRGPAPGQHHHHQQQQQQQQQQGNNNNNNNRNDNNGGGDLGDGRLNC